MPMSRARFPRLRPRSSPTSPMFRTIDRFSLDDHLIEQVESPTMHAAAFVAKRKPPSSQSSASPERRLTSPRQHPRCRRASTPKVGLFAFDDRPRPYADLPSARSICNARGKNPQSPDIGIRRARRSTRFCRTRRRLERVTRHHRNRFPRANQKRELAAFARQANAPAACDAAVGVDLAPTHQARSIAGWIALHDAIDRAHRDARLAAGAGVAIDDRRPTRNFLGRCARRVRHEKPSSE